MTPKKYCAKHVHMPFSHQKTRQKAAVTWWKCGRGYIALCEGYRRPSVLPDMIFAVELDEDNNPVIKQYWGTDPEGYFAKERPKALATVKQWAVRRQISALPGTLTYDNWAKMIQNYCQTEYGQPDIVEIPDQKTFWAEYGLEYNPRTNHVSNPRKLNHSDGWEDRA